MTPRHFPVGRAARLLAAALVLVTGAAALAACSGGGSESTGAADLDRGDARVANVTITAAEGCVSDRRDFPAGAITFEITNRDATAVSEVELLDGERIVGEKENLAPGVPGRFAVTVDAGRYTLYCPGAEVERTPVTVTGASPKRDSGTAVLLRQATDDYQTYVDAQVRYLLTAVRHLAIALHGKNLAAAQRAYMLARPYYEKIEPVAESFTIGSNSLDADIDARANDVPPAQWTGFHRIEKGLFAAQRLAGLRGFGDRLVADVEKLQARTAVLTYQAPELANGAQELLDEVASTKITGEEERYSHVDMLDIANNVEGSQRAFADLQPVLTEIDPALSATIAARYAALDTLVRTFRAAGNPSGYVRYGALGDADRRHLASAVTAVQEPLSQVAGKVANA